MISLASDFPKTVYAIQHVAFEDLGVFEDTLYQAGFRVRYFEAGVDNLKQAFEHTGLVIILGGPISVNETEDYPFLNDELTYLKQRIEQNLPTLGICLGAQLIAQACGAKVYAGSQKEIGWSKLQMTQIEDNLLDILNDVDVLHWHGDTFDLPEQATLLASSELYPNQAFKIGNNILALQFHLEVLGENIEKWLIGHTIELRQAKIDIPTLRAESLELAPQLEPQAERILENFIKQLR